MSWLFAAFVPALLMLATVGLEKLESSLNPGPLQAADIAEFLEQAEPRDVGTLARDGMPKALDGLHRRRLQRIEASVAPVLRATTQPGLYVRSSPSNP